MPDYFPFLFTVVRSTPDMFFFLEVATLVLFLWVIL